MTRDEFLTWLRERQRPRPQHPKATTPAREPGDESEFESVGTFADRLQARLIEDTGTKSA